MKRRQFLIGTGTASIAGSAIIGSGAFSRVASDRFIGINVAEDPDAYLGLDSCDSPNGSYTSIDENGHLQVLLSEENPNSDSVEFGEGVNSNTTSVFDRVFQICNQGKEEACVWISDHENWPTVDEGEFEGERRVELYLESDPEHSVIGEENGIFLDVGDCVCIGIKTRTYGLEEGDELLAAIDNQITINADVDGDCEPECGDLSASYSCTRFDENSMWFVVDHDMEITNTGDAAAEYFWATLGEDMDDNRPLISPVTAQPGQTRTSRTDSDYPVEGIVWWSDTCTTGTIQEYESFFDEHDYLDFEDVDPNADAVPVGGFPSIEDIEASESQGEEVGDVRNCDRPNDDD